MKSSFYYYETPNHCRNASDYSVYKTVLKGQLRMVYQ